MLNEFDSDLTVIVGPNGAGKSSLFQAMRMIQVALTWAGQYSSDAYTQLQEYASALRRQAHSNRMLARMQVELTEPWEQMLIQGFVKALCAGALVDRTPPPDPAKLAEFLSGISIETLQPLLHGDLTVGFWRGPTATWLVAYEFEVNGRKFHVGLQGGTVGQIMEGPMPEQIPSGWRSADWPTRLHGQVDNGKKFTIDALLPSAGEAIPAQVKGNAAFRSAVVSDFLGLIGATADSGREYSFAQLLDFVLTASLALISDGRLPPRTEFSPEDLGRRPNLMDGANVPLELYRLKNGDLSQRQRFAAIQRMFQRLTGNTVELVVRSPRQNSQNITIAPTVIEDGSMEVAIGLAGAGAWEALILATVLCGDPGMVAALDEPAVNLSPTLQRRLADELIGRPGTQVVLVTHSPYLVTIRRVRDLGRIVRVSVRPDGSSQIGRLLTEASNDAVEDLQSRWRQMLAGRTDVRSALFAAGVILVEGDTELGAFDKWFADAAQNQEGPQSPESLNLQVLAVGGDDGFGPYVSYLSACRVPWTVVADGPVLSPNYRGGIPLWEQLRRAGVELPDVTAPSIDATFGEWKGYWEKHRVHTLAGQFGGLEQDATDKSGEIESYFASVDSERWSAARAIYPKSKVRAAHAFAEAVPCPSEVRDLYSRVVEDLTRS